MFFSLKPRTAVNLKDWQEQQILRKRNREAAVRQAWDSNARYFNTWQVNTAEYEALASAQMYKCSMDAYEQQKMDAMKQKNLEERRQRLRELLRKENDQYEIELKEKQAEEERVQPCIGSHLTSAAPSLDPQQTSRSRLDILPSDRIGMTKSKGPVEYSANAGALTSVGNDTPLQTIDTSADAIDELVRQARLAESEGTEIKRKQRNLEKLLADLEHRMNLRKSLAQKHGTEILLHSGRYSRPYKVLLQMRGRHIVECLEFDLMVLNLLMECLRNVEDVAMRNQVMEDQGTIRKYVNVRLKKEQLHLEFAERLFQEEAEQVWFRKVSEWLDDSGTRDVAIDKLMRVIQLELERILTGHLESLQENILLREDLISKIEAARRPASRQLPRLPSTVVNGDD